MSTKCDKCRAIYQLRFETTGVLTDPPCHECRIVLDPRNKEAADIYFEVRDQVLSTYGQVIGLNVIAVKIVMDLYATYRGYVIQDQWQCLKKIKRAFYYFLNKTREQERANQENQQQQSL